MAEIISKEDLIKSEQIPVQNSSFDKWSVIIQLLNSPAVQMILTRLIERYFSQPNAQLNSQNQQIQQPKIDVNSFLSTIITLLNQVPQDITVGELKKWLVENKSEVEKLLSNGLASMGLI